MAITDLAQLLAQNFSSKLLETPQVVETPAYVKIMQGIDAARAVNECVFCAVLGSAGLGKTTACRDYADAHEDTIFIESAPRQTPTEVIRQLGHALGMGLPQRRLSALQTLSQHLSMGGMKIIIMDEAQRLNYQVLDVLKYIGSQSGTMFVLIAHDDLVAQVKRYPDISSRVRYVIRVSGIKSADLRKFYRDEFAPDVLAEMARITAGNMRVIASLIMTMRRVVAQIREIDVAKLTDAQHEELKNQLGIGDITALTTLHLSKNHVQQFGGTVIHGI